MNEATHDMAGKAGRGSAWSGAVRFGTAGQAGPGEAREGVSGSGAARLGKVRQAWLGLSRRALAARDVAGAA